MGSQGYQSKLGIDTTNPVTKQFEYMSESFRKTGTILDGTGISGSRSHRATRTREGNYTVAGSIVLEPCAEDLALLFEWILGGTPVVGTPTGSTTFPIADVLTDRFITIDKVAKVMTYAGCKVNRATFTAGQGEIMRLELELVGKTETVANAGTFPSLTPNYTAPFLFTDGVLTLQAATREMKNFRLTIDNMLEAPHNNSISASYIDPSDRLISFATTNPYRSTETDLYNQAIAGAAGSLVLTNGNYSLTFNFANLQFPAMTPVIGGKTELPLELDGVARRTGSTLELIVILDSTP